MPHGEVLTATIGLLWLGKSDDPDIENDRREDYLRRALGLKLLPSEEMLRKRLDQLGTMPLSMLHEESARLVTRHAPALRPCRADWIPLDIGVSLSDNNSTKKEGVAWTSKKLDGYAPNFAYLGVEGYLIHCELRPGNQHCQEKMPEFLERSIALAREVTQGKLLVLSLGLVAFNVLQLCGKTALAENDRLLPDGKMPVVKPVTRRRLRSVIQDLMYFAARLTKHAHRIGLSLWRSNPWRLVWESIYHRFLTTPYHRKRQYDPESTP